MEKIINTLNVSQVNKIKNSLRGWKPDNNSLIAVFKDGSEKILTCLCGNKGFQIHPNPPVNYNGKKILNTKGISVVCHKCGEKSLLIDDSDE